MFALFLYINPGIRNWKEKPTGTCIRMSGVSIHLYRRNECLFTSSLHIWGQSCSLCSNLLCCLSGFLKVLFMCAFPPQFFLGLFWAHHLFFIFFPALSWEPLFSPCALNALLIGHELLGKWKLPPILHLFFVLSLLWFFFFVVVFQWILLSHIWRIIICKEVHVLFSDVVPLCYMLLLCPVADKYLR